MVFATSDYEKQLWAKGYNLVCGIDEVGRGCFAGPVVVGAVIFSADCKIPVGVADSKLLLPKVRERLALEIKECAKSWAVAEVDVETINKIGIGKATQMAFKKVVDTISLAPDFLLIDAFYISEIEKEKQLPIIGGDRVSISIAAASIIAKVYRDELMEKLDSEYPGYDFGKHKGYGTKAHQEAIKKNGLCPLHRTSFNLSKFT